MNIPAVRQYAKSLAAPLPMLTLLATAPALAHVESGTAEGFVHGFWHPISGPDHVLAMLAVGLWGAQLGAPALWALPVAFPMVMALGGMLGILGLAIPGAELGIAASALALGGMVVFRAQPPLWFAAALVGFFAIFHGNAHGTELPAGDSAILYSIGFVIATGLLHAVGIALGLLNHWKGGAMLVRTAGAAVALAGVFFVYDVFA